MSEGKVYNLSCFSIAPSVGSYRTTHHPFKIVFQMTTKVQVSESKVIPLYGVSLTKLADVCAHTYDYDYLVGIKRDFQTFSFGFNVFFLILK
jgi:hypothetical protein